MIGAFNPPTVLLGVMASAVFGLWPTASVAYQEVQSFQQAPVEAATIHVIGCNGPGENGGQYYIYQYLNRAGFRAILPPNWDRAIGGRDWATFQQAAAAACGGGQVGATPPGGNVAPQGGNVIGVTSATYGGNCNAPAGNVTNPLQVACNNRASCDYKVDYTKIGDPVPGCGKDFNVQWACSGGGGGSAHANPEAGYGAVVSLRCPSGQVGQVGQVGAAPQGGNVAPQGGNVIGVTNATYGGNCNAPAGNVTNPLRVACNNRASCPYTVDYTKIGDPVPGCGKDFNVQWACSGGGGGSAHANPEAGFGAVVNLHCP